MWCLETIHAINQKASELARTGKAEKRALAASGIDVPSNLREPEILKLEPKAVEPERFTGFFRRN